MGAALAAARVLPFSASISLRERMFAFETLKVLTGTPARMAEAKRYE
ncbi:hypothetical protein OKW45_000414 [Paraburkholderia sp. WSM4175]